MATTFLVSLFIASLLSPVPSVADRDHSDLHHRKNRLDNQIDSQRSDVDEVSTQLVRAAARVDAGIADLQGARARLDDLKAQVRQARIVDERMQRRLEQAIVRLADARADLVAGQQSVEDTRDELASFAIGRFQTGGLTESSLGFGLDSATVHAAVDSVQASDTLGDAQTAALQELEAAQVLLRLTEDRVEATKEDVADRRQDAAENLQLKEDLEVQARAAKQEVADRLATLRVERQRAAAAKQQELRRLQHLEHERNRVESRLKKIAERRAAKHNRTLQSPPVGGGGYLSYPVNNTYITSPYGMRMHPILHVWKLHDGTDFHADCGTPVYAAAPGRVSSEYYNTGYGNRLIIDHGYVKGVSLWTSYNHLTSFVAGVGERVNRGELIAYSGTTGYSTACHLHFMVYVNGATVNPVGWL